MSRCRCSMRRPRLLQLVPPTSPSSEAAKVTHCLAQASAHIPPRGYCSARGRNSQLPIKCSALCMR